MRPGAAAAGALGAISAALVGCVDLGFMRDVAFPPGLQGLAPDQPWLLLPVGIWVSEGEIEARAVAGCLAPGCAVQAGIGLFEARGRAASDIAARIAHPGEFARDMARTRLRSGAKSRVTSEVAVERIREAGHDGVAVRIARRDGSRAAYGIVLAASRPGLTTVLVVIALTPEGARRIARETAANLG